MAKTNITLYSSTPSSNTDINNINIDENCPASGLNNAIRELMAHLKNVDTGSQALTALSVTGNVLMGTTNSSVESSSTDEGVNILTNKIGVARDGGVTANFNRLTSDGDIIKFRKDGTAIGSIGVNTKLYIGGSGETHTTGVSFQGSGTSTNRNISPSDGSGALVDGAINLGSSSYRWNSLWLSGGAYLGGTGSANYLDDYEEGTWTPTVLGQTTNPTVTFSAQLGEYIKIGSMVYLWFRLTISTISGGSGTTNIGGLPFGIKSGNAFQANVGGMVDQIASDNKQVSLQPAPSSSVLILISDGGSTSSHAGLQVSELQANTDIRFQIAYSVS